MRRPELWFCIRVGGVWQQVGSGFTLSTSAQTIRRTGNFEGVEAVALVTEAKNWGSNKHTLAALNAFDATVSAAVGESYIVAPSAFGVFAGKDGQVAICEAENEFSFYTPQVGNAVFDISLGYQVQWSGAEWLAARGLWIDGAYSFTEALASPSAVGSGSYSFGPSTAPTQSQDRVVDPVSLTYAARGAGRRLKVRYSAFVNSALATSATTLALFRDNESNAIAWMIKPLRSGNGDVAEEFTILSTDDASHTYKVAVMRESGIGFNGFGRRTFSVEEAA